MEECKERGFTPVQMTKYWFRKRKGLFKKSDSPLGFDLGWGWVPISWEGWLTVIGFVLVVWVLFLSKSGWDWIQFIIGLIVFAFIADLKTEEKVVFK